MHRIRRCRKIAVLLVMVVAIVAAVPCAGQKSKVTKRKAKTEQVTPKKKKTSTTKPKKSTAAASSTLQGISTAKAVDLGLSVKWAGWNVGATSPEGYGGLYGWADAKGSKTSTDPADYPSSTPPRNISGDSRYDIAAARWGGSWRLPTLDEVNELIAQCTWTWGTYRGTKGYKVKGPSGKAIFLPAAGEREGTEVSEREGYDQGGYYWTGQMVDGSPQAYFLYIYSQSHHTSSWIRSDGRSVRPVSD